MSFKINLYKHIYKKILKGIISYFRLKTGLYKSESLPEYDPKLLTNKWPYYDPKCVDDSYAKARQSNPIIDLSICIPLYNEERNILTLLRQIEKQVTQYKIEVILVNDGSIDNTRKIVELFIKGKEDKYRLINTENKGLSSARNTAIDNSIGRYITFIDGDDEICDNYAETLMSVATSKNADITIGYYYSKSGNHLFLSGAARAFAWGKVYRATMFDSIRFPTGYWFEDMINSFLLLPLSQKTEIIHIPVLYHNDTDNSLSKVQLMDKNYKSLEQLYLVMSLQNDYRLLGLTDKSYLHKRMLVECSALMVRRIEKLDENTKHQVFLACNNLFVTNNVNRKDFSGLDRIFADAILDKDYTAWLMATDCSELKKIHWKNILYRLCSI